LWWFGGLLAVKSVANVVNGRALFESEKIGVVSKGRRNTQLRPTFNENKKLKALARIRSAGTLPWLGLATSAKQIDSSE
jgi:hypothetical protein